MLKKRLQHPGYGTEIRALLESKQGRHRSQEQKKIGAVIVDEVKFLTDCKNAGRQHPAEYPLKGDLGEVRALRLYRKGHSIRVYFIVLEAILFMLHVNSNKRTDDLSDGTGEILKSRLRDVRAALKNEGE